MTCSPPNIRTRYIKMGRGPCPNNYIVDKHVRRRALQKRSKGLMKKADELSRICGQEIFVFIIDEDAKVTMFGSSERDFIPDYSSIGGEN